MGGFNARAQFPCYHTSVTGASVDSYGAVPLISSYSTQEIHTASIKAIKVNKVHWMKFPLAAPAKRHLVMFLKMQRTWIHRWKSIRSELLVLLMKNSSSPGVCGEGSQLARACERIPVGLRTLPYTHGSGTAVEWWNLWQTSNHLQALLKHQVQYVQYSAVLV